MKYIRLVLLSLVLLCVVISVCMWNGYRHNKSVSLTPAEVQDPAVVAEKLDVSHEEAVKIVKEVKAATPVMVIEQTDGKSVTLYQIQTEPSWKLGLSLSAQDVGLSLNHGNSVYSVYYDYKNDAYGFRYTFYFASHK